MPIAPTSATSAAPLSTPGGAGSSWPRPPLSAAARPLPPAPLPPGRPFQHPGRGGEPAAAKAPGEIPLSRIDFVVEAAAAPRRRAGGHV